MSNENQDQLLSKSELNEVLDEACSFFESKLTNKHEQLVQLKYGLDRETVKEARIGYIPVDKHALTIHLKKQGWSREEILETGLVYPPGTEQMWQGRIVFPYLVNGKARYFIARETNKTNDYISSKYGKQAKNKDYVSDYVDEPVFGVDTVKDEEILIITEGVTDCLSAHQENYPSIAPVTTQFKGEELENVAEMCSRAKDVYIINDSEESGAGEEGAAKTAKELMGEGITPYICKIPRPNDVDKIDLCDYLKRGGDIKQLLDDSVKASRHEAVKELLKEDKEKRRKKALRKAQRVKNKKKNQENKDNDYLSVEEIVDSLPSIDTLIGFEGRGEHPVHGSDTGTNLAVDPDNQQWFCHRCKGGGSKLEWLAVENGIVECGETLDKTSFLETIDLAKKEAGLETDDED